MLDCKDKPYEVRKNAPDILALLQQAQQGVTDAPDNLLGHFNTRLTDLQQDYLFPKRAQESHLDQGAGILAQNLNAFGNWAELVNDLTASAYHLWCDTASDLEQLGLARASKKVRFPVIDEQERAQIQFLAHYARLLLLMSLEANLYSQRSGFNHRFFAPAFGERRPKSAGPAFTKYIREYFRTLKKWDKKLYAVTGIHHFSLDRIEVERLRALGKAFGPGQAKPLEHGWFSQMDDAKNALWYEYNRSLKGIKRISHDLRGYLILAMANFFSGYGVKPWRYLGGASVMFFVLLGLFFADDVLGTPECRQRATTVSWDNLLSHFSATLGSFTGHDIGARLCGPATDFLTSLGFFGGYFLLAVLASLLFQLLNPDEQ